MVLVQIHSQHHCWGSKHGMGLRPSRTPASTGEKPGDLNCILHNKVRSSNQPCTRLVAYRIPYARMVCQVQVMGVQASCALRTLIWPDEMQQQSTVLKRLFSAQQLPFCGSVGRLKGRITRSSMHNFYRNMHTMHGGASESKVPNRGPPAMV